MNIGLVIKALRSERGLSQEALALEVDTATSNLSRIEKGLRTPSLDLIYRLAKALRVPVSDIFRAAEGGELPIPRAVHPSGLEGQGELPDYAEESVEMRMIFKNLHPANRTTALVIARALKAAQVS